MKRGDTPPVQSPSVLLGQVPVVSRKAVPRVHQVHLLHEQYLSALGHERRSTHNLDVPVCLDAVLRPPVRGNHPGPVDDDVIHIGVRPKHLEQPAHVQLPGAPDPQAVDVLDVHPTDLYQLRQVNNRQARQQHVAARLGVADVRGEESPLRNANGSDEGRASQTANPSFVDPNDHLLKSRALST